MGIITLTSDFGWRDAYVAAMKGVILSLCPTTTLIDITHDVPPQDIRRGAFVLHAAAEFFPQDTVHLVVVDPGVGTTRRAVAVQTPQAFFVAPDNGVLSYALASEPHYRAVEITNPAYHRQPVSATFHGRDVFAPAAAFLCRGVPLRTLGHEVSDLTLFPVPRPTRAGQSVSGEVIYVDHFGNVVTNIREGDVPWERFGTLEIGGRAIARFGRAYAEAATGELMALIGSSGYLEAAEREGNAAARLGVGVGDPVRLVLREPA